MAPSPRLEGRALRVVRGPITLFKEVSFVVAAGECLALRGPNGSGKTTMLRCVAGLTRLDGGEVLREGQILYGGHLPALKDDLTTEENLASALELRGIATTPAERLAALAEAGLDKRRYLPARRLSAGQRRRIGLARLLLDTAPLWILDEPLTALDDAGQALFTDVLNRHLDRGGLALVATHHDIARGRSREMRLGS